MFIIQLTYKTPISEVDKYLQAHREFLGYYYKQGIFIASGPLKPRTGGIILAAINDREKLEEILHQDPYHLAEISDYHIIEFSPVMHCEALKEIIQKTEGKLC